jgi:hypothetical protein
MNFEKIAVTDNDDPTCLINYCSIIIKVNELPLSLKIYG